jgi:hypothetical protein
MSDLTPDDMARLRVRLDDLPGFDPVGLRVFHSRTSYVDSLCITAGIGVVPRERGLVLLDLPATVCLDLSDASTRDRVARWMAGRAVQPFPLGSTAPEVRLTDAMDGRPLLRLVGAGRQAAVFTSVALDGIADLDPKDPRLLPDGSRWVDAAALAEVARHVGVSRG